MSDMAQDFTDPGEPNDNELALEYVLGTLDANAREAVAADQVPRADATDDRTGRDLLREARCHRTGARVRATIRASGKIAKPSARSMRSSRRGPD